MYYLKLALDFVVKHDAMVMTLLVAVAFVVALVNLFYNAYGKQNKQIRRTTRKIISQPRSIGMHVSGLPSVYRRQWRAFCNSNVTKPSLTFEFVPMRNKVVLTRIVALCYAVASLFLIAFALDVSKQQYLIFALGYALLWVMIFVVNNAIFKQRQRTARHVFATFVAELNRYCNAPQVAVDTQAEQTARKLNQLGKGEVTDSVLSRASQLLHGKGLESQRSCAEQRKINDALNSLLQSYARNANNAQSNK